MSQNTCRHLFLSLLISVYTYCQVGIVNAARPNIIFKKTWGGLPQKKPLTELSWPLERVIIIDTAGKECNTLKVCEESVRKIQTLHMKSGNDDIIYNFLIGSDGNIYEGRGWAYESPAAGNYTEGSLTLAFIGTFEKHLPNDAALKAYKALIEYALKITALGDKYRLYGQRQVMATKSPGTALYKLIQGWPNWSSDVF